MSRPVLFVVVSLSGAAVLALEILGTRVLGPYYGVSIYLWSALISVTLAALALGYAIGGRWADRGPRPARLALVLALAGLWVIAVPWLRGPLLAASGGLGLRAAVLVAATLLFLPPLALLGMVSPYAIRLAARRVDEVGRTAGDLFAVSTLASVAAALLTGFVLIPELGVTRLLWLVGAVLLAAALLASRGGRRGGALAALLLAACGLALPRVDVMRPVPGVLAVRDTRYAELRVVEHQGLRYLLLDGGSHTVVDAERAPRQDYIPVMELAAELAGPPDRALVVGLGGGTLARLLTVASWRVDAVEIDPAVTAAAREYFRFQPQFATVHHDDGRRWLRASRDTFGYIGFDAFGSASVPFHLITRECFAEAKTHLRAGGVLAVNLEVVGWHDPLLRAVSATLGTVFRHVTALPSTEPPNALGNVVLVASDRALDVREEDLGDPVATLIDDPEHWRVLERIHAWDNRYVPTGGRALTDDWNPSDLRVEEINLVARRQMRTLLPDSLLGG
jgi:spermidine synthase